MAHPMVKKGYIPLSFNEYGGISWQGEYLADFWMWNKQYSIDVDGKKQIQTVRVTELKEAAIRYWRDGWVPVRPVSERFLRRMEDALRSHQGIKRAGVRLPETDFLRMPNPIPDEFAGTELKRYLAEAHRGNDDAKSS